MKNRLSELREILGDAIAKTVEVENKPEASTSSALLRLCQKAACKAQSLHSEIQKIPEPKKGD